MAACFAAEWVPELHRNRCLIWSGIPIMQLEPIIINCLFDKVSKKSRTDHWIITMIDPGFLVPLQGQQRARRYRVKPTYFHELWKSVKLIFP